MSKHGNNFVVGQKIQLDPEELADRYEAIRFLDYSRSNSCNSSLELN